MLSNGIRIAFLVMGVAAAVGTAMLMLRHQGSLAAKTGWLAALLLVIAADPTRFGPSSAQSAAGSNFHAIGFGLLSAFFVVALTVLLFFVQLPHERLPHFDGRVSRLVQDGSRTLPEVQFEAADGRQVTYIDRIAPVMFPSRQFREGETVSVIAVDRGSPRIDEPLAVRWSAIGVLAAMALVTGAFAVSNYLRSQA